MNKLIVKEALQHFELSQKELSEKMDEQARKDNELTEEEKITFYESIK